MGNALGIIEVEGIGGIIAAADAACKTAAVELLGWESIGGMTSLFFRGSAAEVAASLDSGCEAALQLVDRVIAAPLTQPESACVKLIGNPTQEDVEIPPGALGFLESRGYSTQLVANDRMIKAAPIDILGLLTVHDRIVCTLINGEDGAVREAIAAGRAYFSNNEHFFCSSVIPNPSTQVLRAFAPNS